MTTAEIDRLGVGDLVAVTSDVDGSVVVHRVVAREWRPWRGERRQFNWLKAVLPAGGQGDEPEWVQDAWMTSDGYSADPRAALTAWVAWNEDKLRAARAQLADLDRLEKA